LEDSRIGRTSFEDENLIERNCGDENINYHGHVKVASDEFMAMYRLFENRD